ncbi:general stress protein [Actinomyces faecalis]|uniref:general stress protein n=1 Tax=Actinomyces faecalis TaxID=2722820 RepID=UPI001F2ED824|nr:general stress protein [Actinomyces faecalis]
MSQPIGSPSPQISRALRGRTMPPGEEVASFSTYAEAQHAVDALSDEGFPVQHLAIIGTDLRQVENITGRMSWGRAIVSGAASGLWLGLFFGALLALVGPSQMGGAALIASAVIMGVVWGTLFQVIGYAMTRGKRDFTSTSAVIASRYSIIAAQHAPDAARALASLPGNLTRGGEAARRAQERRAARQAARDGAPTAFGSRPDEQPRFGVRVSDQDQLRDLAAEESVAAPREEVASAEHEAAPAQGEGATGSGTPSAQA